MASLEVSSYRLHLDGFILDNWIEGFIDGFMKGLVDGFRDSFMASMMVLLWRFGFGL
jgi:hypothetical protein